MKLELERARELLFADCGHKVGPAAPYLKADNASVARYYCADCGLALLVQAMIALRDCAATRVAETEVL